ncbi:MAG: zf-HC2 domain-containing protein, partial [Acidobacteriota bacterium]|nr:zf-HC2 domain-containing protein [Acidobacteriota bacterium]
MNCEQCQDLISVYLDNELENQVRVELQTHLALCAECAKVCEDFAMILNFCELDESEHALPPNPKALWCRINNLIETEIAPEIKQAEIKKEVEKRRRWQFSFSQVFAA